MSDNDIKEVWLAINEDGDYGIGIDSDSAKENLEENYNYEAIRLIKLNVKVRAPKPTTEVMVDVPDDAGTTEKVEVTAE